MTLFCHIFLEVFQRPSPLRVPLPVLVRVKRDMLAYSHNREFAILPLHFQTVYVLRLFKTADVPIFLA